MENAVDALKISFAVFALVLAIAIIMPLISITKTTSDAVIEMSNKETYAEFVFGNEESKHRNVGIETIIPTLYRYYNERYAVAIVEKNDSLQDLFDLETERLLYSNTNKSNENQKFSYNVDSLYNSKLIYASGILWTAKESDANLRIDAYVSGLNTIINGKNLLTDKLDWSSTYLETFSIDNTDVLYTVQDYNDSDAGGNLNNDGSEILLVRGSEKVHIEYKKK
ncbi:MAG: hypothetical protein LBL91_05285 [Lachnospiraceae bacterium]|jgi:hypothetical protein|nr:hypothetical protein [Lachnospiraceae bacterium]